MLQQNMAATFLIIEKMVNDGTAPLPAWELVCTMVSEGRMPTDAEMATVAPPAMKTEAPKHEDEKPVA